jgi:hypothetical protein
VGPFWWDDSLLRARPTCLLMICSILASVIITRSCNSLSCCCCWSLDLLWLL